MRKIWFIILLLLFLPNYVYGLEIECPNKVAAGEEFSCVLYEKELLGLKVNYQFDESFTMVGFRNLSSWREYYQDVHGFSVGNIRDDSEGKFELRFKVEKTAALKSYGLNFVRMEGSDRDYKHVQIEDVSRSIQVVSDVNTLSNLRLNNGKLSPRFDADIFQYQATINASTTNIEATLTDSSSRLEGDIGEQSLNYGINSFTIRVISARGNVREYKIFITRPNVGDTLKNSDATLKSLQLSHGKINFMKDKYFYQVEVGYEVEKIEIKALPSNDKASVSIENPGSLVVGVNEIKIVVTAVDGNSATYVLVVNRAEKKVSDARIRKLKIKGYSLLFDPDIYEYELKIASEDKLGIEVILFDEKAKYKVKGNQNLEDGSVIMIEVETEDKTTKTYWIRIKKQRMVILVRLLLI